MARCEWERRRRSNLQERERLRNDGGGRGCLCYESVAGTPKTFDQAKTNEPDTIESARKFRTLCQHVEPGLRTRPTSKSQLHPPSCSLFLASKMSTTLKDIDFDDFDIDDSDSHNS